MATLLWRDTSSKDGSTAFSTMGCCFGRKGTCIRLITEYGVWIDKE